MSKVITRPRLGEGRIPIGIDQNKPEERMVPESAYRELEVKSRLAAEEGYRRGFEEGKKTGYSEGLSHGKSESKNITDQIQPLLSDIARQKNEILLFAENDLLNLALMIAEKVVGSLASSHKELVIDTIKKSLPILLEKSRLTIKVAPEQEESSLVHLIFPGQGFIFCTEGKKLCLLMRQKRLRHNQSISISMFRLGMQGMSGETGRFWQEQLQRKSGGMQA